MSEVSYEYNPETGVITRAGGSRPGAMPRKPNALGYLTGRYDGEDILQHRLAFFLMEGRWPVGIDHINGDRADNRWCNLREATQQENRRNVARQSNNSSGVNGVSKVGNRWRAYVWVGGKRIHLGYFGCITGAAISRKLADIKYGFHENHGRPLQYEMMAPGYGADDAYDIMKEEAV